jgi:hypothetical protein
MTWVRRTQKCKAHLGDIFQDIIKGLLRGIRYGEIRKQQNLRRCNGSCGGGACLQGVPVFAPRIHTVYLLAI